MMQFLPYARIILINLLPSLLIFVGRNDHFFCWLGDHQLWPPDWDIGFAQTLSFALGIIFVGLITPIQLAREKERGKKRKQALRDLTMNYKNLIFRALSARDKAFDYAYNTQIFIPEKGIKNWFRKGTILVLKEIDGISDTLGLSDIQFKVDEKANYIEGVVGQAFLQPGIVVDFDLRKNNYQLTEEQRKKMNGIHFWSAARICKNNKVVAVLVVSSYSKLSKKVDTEIWRAHMQGYGAFVLRQLN